MLSKLEHCGLKARPCIRVDESAGKFGEQGVAGLFGDYRHDMLSRGRNRPGVCCREGGARTETPADEIRSAAAVAALLVTNSSLSEAEGATLVKVICGNNADLLAAGSAEGGQLGVAIPHTGISIPFAAGAEEALSGLRAAQLRLTLLAKQLSKATAKRRAA